MSFLTNKIEFDLTVKKYGHKEESMYDHPIHRKRDEEEPEPILLEKLEFKSISAKEVIRKLLDYIRD